MKKMIKHFSEMPMHKKIEAIIAATTTIAIFTIPPTFAWLTQKQDMAAMTKVNAPFNIYITASHHQNIQEFDLSDIDTKQSGVGYKDYVFCVRGSKEVSSYDIQIAHTTNINFTYELYHAQGLNSPQALGTYDNLADNVTKVGNTNISYTGDIVSYQKDSESPTYTYQIGGTNLMAYNPNYDRENDSDHLKDAGYLNGAIVNGRLIGSDFSDYSEDDNPQIYAQALYWKNPSPVASYTTQNLNKSEDFDHYYVLRLRWTQTNSEDSDDMDVVQNNKETDIVYITAEVHGG